MACVRSRLGHPNPKTAELAPSPRGVGRSGRFIFVFCPGQKQPMSRRLRKRPSPLKSGAPAKLAAAGVLRRLTALIYDSVLLAGVLFAATLLVLPLRGGQAFASNDPLYSGYLAAVTFFFFGWFWTHGGETPGMRAWKIRLIAAEGGAVSWQRSALRYAAAPLSAACLGLGYLWSWFDPQGRSWHDLVSKTRVIRIDFE